MASIADWQAVCLPSGSDEISERLDVKRGGVHGVRRTKSTHGLREVETQEQYKTNAFYLVIV
jgi:hypothetical protein